MATGTLNVDIDSQIKSRIAINTTLGDFVAKILPPVLIVGGLATFMYLILGGVQWITAGGDKGKITEARDKITQAVIGLAIVACAWAVSMIVNYFFGIPITMN
jgi:hypothetical protein